MEKNDVKNEGAPRKRVAIVGAGASGLSAARQALDYGVEPVVFESSFEVGGLWRFKPEETDDSSVMKSTVINTSKEMTAFSDFPPAAHLANFMHNRRMFEYLNDYCHHFGLTKFIRFGHKVESVSRSTDYQENGTWMVTFRKLTEKEPTSAESEKFDGVLLCTGHHTQPFLPPKWPGQDEYEGKISHAHSYKDHRGFEDKVVAVVGVGNSGVDVAVELSRVGKQVYLVTRRGTWVLNRNSDYSEPFDLVLNRRCLTFFLEHFPLRFCSAFITHFVQKRLDHGKYGLRPDHHIFAAHWTVNDELSNRLSCGTIIVKPNISFFTRNGLTFADGTHIDKVDHVILCTGYSFGFPLLEDGELISVRDNEVELYKYMFPLETSDHNTLSVIGCIQPLGSIMPISEMQARVFFDVFTGRSRLPNRAEMQADIRRKKQQMECRYVKSRRHTIQVDYVLYMDELSSLIGCNPCTFTRLISDPCMALRILFGPNYPYLYRLHGPKAWPDARNAILDADRRKECGMRGECAEIAALKKRSKLSNFTLIVMIWLAILIGMLCFWLLFL